MKTLNHCLISNKKVLFQVLLLYSFSFLFTLPTSTSQTYKWKDLTANQNRSWGIYLNPTHAFTNNGTIELGAEYLFRKNMIGSIGVGHRIKKSTDPIYEPYETQEYLSNTIRTCVEETDYFLFLPISNYSSCYDSTFLTYRSEKYINKHSYINASIKLLSSDYHDNPQPMIIELGIKTQFINYFSYEFSDGLILLNRELIKKDNINEGSVLDGNFRTIYYYDVEQHKYNKLTKATLNEILITAYISYGLRFNLTNKLSIEGKVSAFYGRKIPDLNQSKKLRGTINCQLGYWF